MEQNGFFYFIAGEKASSQFIIQHNLIFKKVFILMKKIVLSDRNRQSLYLQHDCFYYIVLFIFSDLFSISLFFVKNFLKCFDNNN